MRFGNAELAEKIRSGRGLTFTPGWDELPGRLASDEEHQGDGGGVPRADGERIGRLQLEALEARPALADREVAEGRTSGEAWSAAIP